MSQIAAKLVAFPALLRMYEILLLILAETIDSKFNLKTVTA